MSKNKLTVETVRQVLNYCAKTGRFTWAVKTCRGVVPGNTAGFVNPDGYRIISIGRIRNRASRLAWLYVTGKWPEYDIDHINGQRDDNRFENLRDVSRAENLQNQRKKHERNRSSKYLGVSKGSATNRFRARICTYGVTKHLGWFATEEEAYAAYVAEKRKRHRTCTL